jgi:hypothetical protein
MSVGQTVKLPSVEGMGGNLGEGMGVRVNQRIRFLPNANDFPPVSAGKLGEGEGS